MNPKEGILEVAITQENHRKKTDLKVAFQGELGAYSQSAIYSFFGKTQVGDVVPLATLRQVFFELCLNDSALDCAVVPIENSVAGSVGETLDLLLASKVKIVGEVGIPVRHSLIVHRDCPEVGTVRRVISHPQALAQCSVYLDSKNWQQTPVYDTAGSVKMLRDQKLLDTAAIASELAAEIYGMKIAERNIEDDHTNMTRFVVIEKANSTEEGKVNKRPASSAVSVRNYEGEGYKTSLLFSTKHLPGSLVEALSALSKRGINLTKIESRPIKSRPWEYYFYVDFEGNAEKDHDCIQALQELQQRTLELKVLGSYKRGL